MIVDSDQAKSALRLPVPKVFAWSANPANLVGSEYIIMEEAPGIQLGNVWDEMGLSDQLKVVEDLVAIEKKCSSISFTLSVFHAQDKSTDAHEISQVWESFLRRGRLPRVREGRDHWRYPGQERGRESFCYWARRRPRFLDR